MIKERVYEILREEGYTKEEMEEKKIMDKRIFLVYFLILTSFYALIIAINLDYSSLETIIESLKENLLRSFWLYLLLLFVCYRYSLTYDPRTGEVLRAESSGVYQSDNWAVGYAAGSSLHH